MSERDFDSLLTAWMDLGRTDAPHRVADAAVLEIRSTRQAAIPMGWLQRRFPYMTSRTAKFALAAATAVAAAVGASVLWDDFGFGVPAPAVTAEPTATPNATPTATLVPTPAAAMPPSMLPDLHIPRYGALRNTQPKDYGWTGAPGASADMHNVYLHAEMVFAVENDHPDCFARGEGPEPVPTTVAGLDGLYVEPYGDDPRARFEPGDPVTTGAYALAVGDRTLCVYLSWGPDASATERQAARAVLDSLRAQPFGAEGVRIVFTTLGWDNG